jgi:hypothetical protein
VRDINKGVDTVLRKDMDFQHTYLEGIFLLFKEASAQGLLSEYEDLIDTLYHIFPNKQKRSIWVYDSDLQELVPCPQEWKKALAIGPPVGDPRLNGSGSTELKVQVRQRCLRKAQIVTDIAERLKLIGEEFDDVEMGEDSEVFKRVTEIDRQVRPALPL